MKKYRNVLYITILNFCLSICLVYLSPRFDILTLSGFLFLNFLLLFLLVKNEEKNETTIEEEIDNIFLLLHSLELERENHEVTDDNFGKLRDEILKIIVEGKRITDEAEKNREVLREYTEDIAHQIKTPLTGVLLLLDLLESDEKNSEDYIGRLRNSVIHIYDLSDNLLKLAALDSGTIEMKREEIYIREIIGTVLKDMDIYFPDVEGDIPVYGEDCIFICDKKWTYEALFNIVKNGIEASKNKRIQIYIKETKVFKSIIVEDFSEGLNREMLQKVFKRFYKINPNSKGYGIGLPMAKSVMEKQDGELLYQRGKGSNSFELRFYN